MGGVGQHPDSSLERVFAWVLYLLILKTDKFFI